MIASILKVKLIFLFSIIMASTSLYGQVCDNRYLSLTYKGSSYDTFTKSISTKNEIVSAGGLSEYNNAGHIAKYSSTGTPFWSYTYVIDFYSFYPSTFFKTIHFRDLISTADGGYLVSGNFDKVLSPYGIPPPVQKFALLAKIDRFGNVLWSKTLNSQGHLSFSNIVETSDGDYIGYLATDNGKKELPGDHSYGRVLRIAPDGKIKWSTLLFTYLFDAGGLGLDFKRAIIQNSNKNIVLGQVVHQTVLNNGKYKINQGNLHFLELDYATGKVNWETSYEYPVPPSDTLYTPDIYNIQQLPDGRLSFTTALYLSTNNQPALTKKGANIITSAKGKIENLIAYYPANGNSIKINEVAADKSNGTKTIWFNNAGADILTNTSNDGQINWSKGFNNEGGQYPINCFSIGGKGYHIFTSNNTSLNTRLLITDTGGAIDCVNAPATIIAEAAAFDFPHDSVITSTTIEFDNFQDNGFPFAKKEIYPIIKNIACQQTISCCVDTVDSTNITHINICEGKNYMLPDSTIVKDSGTYYVTFKTRLGCDSIRFYELNIDKDINKLSLGKDTCIKPPNSIKLLATAGYKKYYWLNNVTDSNETITITRPGNYWVTVSNSCGIKTDSITIFDQCDYPLYMPKAFTPNNDHLNDYFRISPLNKNKLISMKIFNRWGKLVFETTNPQEGWDGRLRNEPLPSDAFIYTIKMEGLSGKLIYEKGSFILVR